MGDTQGDTQRGTHGGHTGGGFVGCLGGAMSIPGTGTVSPEPLEVSNPPGAPWQIWGAGGCSVPTQGGSPRVRIPPPVRTSCFPFIRQMLMSCWFERHVSFWGGAEKPTWGWGEASRTHGPPPEPPSTYPVIAHLAGTAGLQAHPVDVVPGEGDRGVTTLMGCPPHTHFGMLGGGCVIYHPSREMWGSGVGDEHHQGPSRCSS